MSEISNKYIFRNILQTEADQAVAIEQICFPPHEACSEKHMKERIVVAADTFFVAIDKESGKIAGFINGVATDEERFRDEFFTDAELHKKNGSNIMILGLDVLPEYRGQGLAREIVARYAKAQKETGRKKLVLTCLPDKVKMYEKMGFVNIGLANSTWGNEQWYEMERSV